MRGWNPRGLASGTTGPALLVFLVLDAGAGVRHAMEPLLMEFRTGAGFNTVLMHRMDSRRIVFPGLRTSSASWAQARLVQQGFWTFMALMVLLSIPFILMLWSARRQNRRLATEIQERLEAEESLRKSEQDLRSLFDGSPIGIFRSTSDGYFRQVNPAMATMLRYEDPATLMEEVARQGGIATVLYEHPEERLCMIDALQRQPGVWLTNEIHLRCKDGAFMDAIQSILLPPDSGAGHPEFFGFLQDITERKQGEEILRQNMAHLRTLIDTIPDLVWLKDVHGVYQSCNLRFERFVGAKEKDIIGKTDFDFVDKDLAAFFRENDLRAMAKGGPSVNEERVVYAEDGHTEDLETIKTPILGHDGTIMGVLGIGRDITARKRAEEAVLESERHLRSLFDGSPIGMFHATKEGRFQQVNMALANMFLYADPAAMVEEISGLGIPEAMSESPLKRSDLLRRLQERQGTWLVEEVHFRRSDGTFMDGIMSVILRPDPGTKQPVISGFIQDITDQKRSEQEIQTLKTYLASIIDSMPMMLVGLDEQGVITQWNRQASIETDLPAREVLGRSMEVVLPDFAPWIQTMRQEMIRREEPVARERVLLEKGQERRFYDIMLYPLLADGKQGAVVRIEDVSERIRIQELMIQTEKMMSVGGLAAGMAHEINNPLSIISQASQNIERRFSEELPANRAIAGEIGLDLALLRIYFKERQIGEFMASIREAVGRATRIVGNMLQFSRKSDTDRQPASLIDLVEQSLELVGNDYDLKKKYDFRSIEILRDFEPDLPPVSVVAIEVEQVILNLLRNAAQAMSENPAPRRPVLSLRVRREPRYVVLEVEDNGPGMDEAVRRRIFEPFFTTKEPGVGTGLGLSVSYMIITQNHKGLMEVASAPGQGARFTIRLPLYSENQHG